MADDQHPDNNPNVEMAAMCMASSCQHGTVFITFLRADGTPFAAAAMDLPTATDMLEGFGQSVEDALEVVKASMGISDADGPKETEH
jgi:hypothetical protein